MSKRPSTSDVFQSKVTRNDRFAQMSHQEKVIEQRKREIQARLEQKQKGTGSSAAPSTSNEEKSTSSLTTSSDTHKHNASKSHSKRNTDSKCFNQFSNDGSFLDQFKQIKGRKLDQKLKSFRCSQDRNNSEDHNKNSRWSSRCRSPSPKIKMARFPDKLSLNEPKISISTCYSNLISQANFTVQPQIIQPQITITTQDVVGQPLMKNAIGPPLPSVIAYSTSAVQTASVITASPVILNVPPPQVIQQSLVTPPPALTTAILTSASSAAPNLPPPNIITTLIPPPVQISACAPTLELAAIPPPNPIQIQNIPQPEPLNTLNIPPPAPLQVQNIPPPSPIQLNEIPNPKPLDVINIPTPSDSSAIILEKAMSDPDFIKNVPPPNKSVPPPNLQDTTINLNIAIPPPNTIHLPPQSQTISVQNIIPTQNLIVHSIPPLPPLISTQTLMPPAVQNVTLVSHVQNLAPPPPPPQPTLPTTSTISVALTVQNSQAVGSTNVIPSLLAQPVLPPSGMSVTTIPVNIHCPPPSVSVVPPSFINQPPPITTQLPPVNIPPPTSSVCATTLQPFMDINSVCPPGTPEYEAMASLGRMVAECGPGIEDVVRQRKPEDPNLWFLFHKESMAYQQYLQLVSKFKSEIYKPEDIYEPEKLSDDYKSTHFNTDIFSNVGFEDCPPYLDNNNRRRRRSRWGGKDLSVPPPTVVLSTPPPAVTMIPVSTNPVILSQITRNDPALIQYAIVTYGTTNLSEEDWKKAEENYKINLVYQDMLKKKDEAARLANAGKNRYEYDSDEDIDGGTWEHKLRTKEMEGTHQWANDLTRNAEGKHHIGDFLPHDELHRFIERNSAVKEGRQPEISDYKDFKIKEDNVGFKMLQKLGWMEGQGLGANASGIVDPVNKSINRDHNQGLGLANPSNVDINDDEYDAYRKRMMLAYRFRPNPLNNPRRPYY